MLPAPAALLFDLDGVLVDSYRVWFHLLNAAARAWDYPSISVELFDQCWGQGVQADQERFYPQHDIPAIDVFYAEHFEDHIEHLDVPKGVPELFAALRERGLPSAVVTNTPNPLAGAVVRRAGASPDHVIGGTDVPNAKPAPDMVLVAAERVGAPPERCWMVGDSAYDREAARAAGTVFVGIGIEGAATLADVGGLVELIDASLSGTPSR